MKNLTLGDSIVTVPVNEGEAYGVDTLIAVAKFAGESKRKIQDFSKDGKYSFMEKVRTIPVITGAINLGKRWKEIKNEFLDQDGAEKVIVVDVLMKEFNWDSEEAITYYNEFTDLMITLYEFFNKHTEGEEEEVEA